MPQNTPMPPTTFITVFPSNTRVCCHDITPDPPLHRTLMFKCMFQMIDTKQMHRYLLDEDAHNLQHEHLLHDDSLYVAEADMMGERQRHHALHGHDQLRQRVLSDSARKHHRHAIDAALPRCW